MDRNGQPIEFVSRLCKGLLNRPELENYEHIKSSIRSEQK